jgi:2-polyprenyl-6-methoxyphenol hydroxylase-like FAD-dependent oxidoreductase
MADIIVIGAGLGGLGTGLLLARDGHRVRVLERDAEAPPDRPDDLWTAWERRGVNQFRMLHSFLARWRETVDAELPEVAAELILAGGLRTNPVAAAPAAFSGGPRPGDERFDVVTGRRPVVEAAMARVAARTPGLTVERGVAVRGLTAADRPLPPGTPHVTGVVTEDGRQFTADLVVDTTGRRSPLPGWLAALGAPAPVEERDDAGFLYYGRHFRSTDGSLPPAFGPPLQPYDSLSLLLLAADNGTWGIGIITSAADSVLRAARHEDVWTRVVKNYPLAAHWLEGEPISDVDVMAKLEDRHRRYWRDGAPVATGVAAVADAWACTNPSVGRGATLAVLHAVCLRDVLREVPVADDPMGFARRFDEATLATVEPLYRETVAFDRHRLAEIDAQIAGRPYETDDPGWQQEEALRATAPADPELFRTYVAVRSVLERRDEAWARPGVAERVAAATPAPPLPGPSRADLVAIVG